jgi:hypothetical protein
MWMLPVDQPPLLVAAAVKDQGYDKKKLRNVFAEPITSDASASSSNTMAKNV